MSDQAATVEYVVRVKLPSAAGYSSCPSGDGDYESDYNKAILAAKPPGFEVSWSSKDTWPVDKHGLTWVRLYLTDQKRAVEYFQDRAESHRKDYERLKQMAERMVNG